MTKTIYQIAVNRPNGHIKSQHVLLKCPQNFSQIDISRLKIYDLATLLESNLEEQTLLICRKLSQKVDLIFFPTAAKKYWLVSSIR
jgi:hypothetical protein